MSDTKDNLYSGAILEISLRVGVTPLNIPPRDIFLTIFLSYTHKKFRSLFNKLYMLYFVQNFPYIYGVWLVWLRFCKKLIVFSLNGHLVTIGPIVRMAPDIGPIEVNKK